MTCTIPQSWIKNLQESCPATLKSYLAKLFQLDSSNNCDNKPGLLSQQILSQEQISELAIKLLKIIAPVEQLKDQSRTIYHELEFFASNDKTASAPDTYFTKICNAASITGQLYLKNILLNYTDNLEVLHERQGILTYLTGLDKARLTYLSTAREWFAKSESVLYWNINDKTPEMVQVLDMLFFNKAWNRVLNTNNTFMGIYFYLVMIITPLWGIFSPVIFFFVPYLIAKYIIKLPIPFEFYLEQMKSMLFGKQFFGMIKIAHKVFEGIYKPAEGGIENIKTKLIDKVFSIITHDFGRYIYLAFVIISYIYGVYTHIMASMNYNKLLNFIHERINYIRDLLDNSVMCLDVLDEYRKKSLELDVISSTCLDLLNTNPVIKILRSCCEFKQAPGFFVNKGNIVKTYYLLEKIDRAELLSPFIKLMGWIDCWLGSANLIKTGGMVLAKWDIAGTLPSLDLVDCISPVGGNISNSIVLCKLDNINNPVPASESSAILAPESPESAPEETIPAPESSAILAPESSAIPASESPESAPEEPIPASESSAIPAPESEVEQSEPAKIQPNCLLTGPNGSGKSTFLKAIMSAVIMAQTLGCVPARSCRLTPFKYLSTYLNIPDCQGRESLFQAEMRRCHNHLEKLKQLESPESPGFSLNIMDEIFVSTNYMEGLSGAYGVIKSLEKYPNSLNIITTHFDKLTTKPLPTFCYKYFTIDVHETETGETKITKDYKLRDGVNDKHMALHLLKLRGFDKELVANAMDIYNELASDSTSTANNIQSSNVNQSSVNK